MSETYFICEGCRERVDPGSPDIVRAVELHDARTMGNPNTVVEGLGVYFHRGCWPGEGFGYRLKPLEE